MICITCIIGAINETFSKYNSLKEIDYLKPINKKNKRNNQKKATKLLSHPKTTNSMHLTTKIKIKPQKKAKVSRTKQSVNDQLTMQPCQI